MNLSLNWLKDYVDIPRGLSAKDLGLRLTMHTVEVDGIIQQGEKLNGVVVGEILEIKKHPDADKLSIAKVDVGEREPRQIVFGQMAEIKIGYKIPVALAPTILPTGQEIKKAKLRGELSEGMLCLDQELGLVKEGVSIRFFDKEVKNGTSIVKALNLDDTIFELDNKSITHRPDLWSHYGIAREIAAFLGTKFKEYKPNQKILKKSKSIIKLNGKVEDFNLCPRYMAIALDGIKIEDSPKWMQEKLMAIGMRPINNIVDTTNYVMLELGQPLHAFDAKILGEKIIVRRAKDKEVLETLDGEKRELNKNDLLITDGTRGVALAGVMGGKTSEINNNTEKIVLESANFNFSSIRKTSAKIGLRTESSMRFEKGLDPNLAEIALIRAVELIKKLNPKARVISNLIDENKFKLNQGPIELDLSWLAQRIGQEIKEKEVIKILTSLGFKVKRGRGRLSVIVPTWRATGDIEIAEDLVEEITRIYGYEKINPVMPYVAMKKPEVNEERVLRKKIRNILVNANLIETYNYSFVGEDQLNKLNLDSSSSIRLANPIAQNQTLLRESLAPNLFNNIKTNQANFETISLFEIGSIYSSEVGEINKDNKGKEFLPREEKSLGIIIGENKGDVFRKVKGVVEFLMLSLNLSNEYEKNKLNIGWADNNINASIIVNKKNIGYIAELSSSVANKISIKKKVVVAEINLKMLFSLVKGGKIKKYKPLEKYPSLVRDLAFVVDSNILYNDIRDRIKSFDKLISEVELFDVYEGGKLGEGKKSLAFHVIYQSNKTLTSEEVDSLQNKLVSELENKFDAKIRDF